MKIFYSPFQKKELSTNEQPESNENAKIWYIVKGKTEDKYAKDKKHHNVRGNCYYRSSYDCGFIIK